MTEKTDKKQKKPLQKKEKASKINTSLDDLLEVSIPEPKKKGKSIYFALWFYKTYRAKCLFLATAELVAVNGIA
ncbi:hypothetical protein [Flaviramulus basaltis]|uniref:hypothetical protein n=1 Tax=Flaviramulus basaltis TaxID=369401 RepID=UPI0009312C06|nr:hypothetical protein [Flaviramulus basaltis]